MRYLVIAAVVWVALVGFWVYKQQSGLLGGNPIAQCCADGQLLRYPDGFEICPQCRDLFGTLCPHRTVSPTTFDKAMTQVQRLLALKRSLIMLTKKIDTTAARKECAGVAENARELALRAVKDFLHTVVDAQIATWENANQIMKFAHDVVTRHAEDVQKFCAEPEK